jgi:hypothetical protein
VAIGKIDRVCHLSTADGQLNTAVVQEGSPKQVRIYLEIRAAEPVLHGDFPHADWALVRDQVAGLVGERALGL